MTLSASLVGLYQELQKLHAEMAESAVCQRFAELPEQQSQVDALVSRIKTLPPTLLTMQQRSVISGLISAILADQTLIKAEITDWQSDIQPLLASFDVYPPGK